MPSNRIDKQIFPFFNSVRTPVTVTGASESFHNAGGYASLTIEVDGTVEGRVEGCINIINPDDSTKTDAQCAWGPLALIDMKDFKTLQSFDAPGHYTVGINGMARVRVVITSITGEATIIGVAEV